MKVPIVQYGALRNRRVHRHSWPKMLRCGIPHCKCGEREKRRKRGRKEKREVEKGGKGREGKVEGAEHACMELCVCSGDRQADKRISHTSAASLFFVWWLIGGFLFRCDCGCCGHLLFASLLVYARDARDSQTLPWSLSTGRLSLCCRRFLHHGLRAACLDDQSLEILICGRFVNCGIHLGGFIFHFSQATAERADFEDFGFSAAHTLEHAQFFYLYPQL